LLSDDVDQKRRMDVNTVDVLAGRHQTGTALDTVEYGWTILPASVQRLSLVTATTVAGVAIIVVIMKTSPSLATMHSKMVHSRNVLSLRVWRIQTSLIGSFTVTAEKFLCTRTRRFKGHFSGESGLRRCSLNFYPRDA